MTRMGHDNDEEPEEPASELDAESLFARLFPDEIREWIRGDDADDDEDEDREDDDD